MKHSLTVLSYSLGLVFSPVPWVLAGFKSALLENFVCFIKSFSVRDSLDTILLSLVRQQMDLINPRLPISKCLYFPMHATRLVTNTENKILFFSHCYLTGINRSKTSTLQIQFLTNSSDDSVAKIHLLPSSAGWKHLHYKAENNIPLSVQTNQLFCLPQQTAAYPHELWQHFICCK